MSKQPESESRLFTYLGYVVALLILTSAVLCSEAGAAEPPAKAPAIEIKYAPPGVVIAEDLQVFRIIDTEVGAVCYVTAVDGAEEGLKDPVAEGISCFKIDLVKKPAKAAEEKKPPAQTPTSAPKP